MILAPAGLLIAEYINSFNSYSDREKFYSIFLTFLNFLWSVTFAIRNNLSLRNYFSTKIFFILIAVSIILVCVYFLSKYLSKKKIIQEFYYVLICSFFISLNLYYLIFIPSWENNYQISGVKEIIEKSSRNNILYISTDFRYNPQFSFYFNGLNLKWDSNKYNYELIDTKNGIEKIKTQLGSLVSGKYNIIVEGDNINRSDYVEPNVFIPGNFNLVYSTYGYKLYQN